MKLTTNNLTFLVYPFHADPPVAKPSGWVDIPTGLRFTDRPEEVYVLLEDDVNLRLDSTEYTEDGELVIVLRNTSTRLSVNLRDYPVIAKVILQDPPDGS